MYFFKLFRIVFFKLFQTVLFLRCMKIWSEYVLFNTILTLFFLGEGILRFRFDITE